MIWGTLSGTPVFEAFKEGAAEGIELALRIMPTLIALLCAIGMLRASGALDAAVAVLSPLAEAVSMPRELLPLALLRPISGSGSLALVSDIIKTYGADSYIGRCASVMMASTETTFYTIAVYFGAVNVKKTAHTVWAALFADAVSFIASVFFVRLFLS